MKHNKAIFSLLLLTFLSLGGKAMAYDFSARCSSGQILYYTITSDKVPLKVELTFANTTDDPYQGHKMPSGDLVIPDKVTHEGKTYSVASISHYAFYNCNQLYSVEVPISVFGIGESAFRNCRALESIKIGKQVVFIGASAFLHCDSLNTVYFNAVNCATMGDSLGSVFGGCPMLKTLVIGFDVQDLPDYAFNGCRALDSVRFAIAVQKIGKDAFRNCTSLTKLLLPEKLETIGVSAFEGCTNLREVRMEKRLKSIAARAFAHCDSLRHVEMAPSVESIGNQAFYECVSLADIEFPAPLYEVGYGAFSGCSNLGMVAFNAVNCGKMSQSPEPIFSRCKNLSTIIFGNGIKAIPDSAFYRCISLGKDLDIPASVERIGRSAFLGTHIEGTLSLKGELKSVGKDAFAECDFGKISYNVSTPSQSLGDWDAAFRGIAPKVGIEIGSEVTNLPPDLFALIPSCWFIPVNNSQVRDYGYGAFYACGISFVNIPAKVENIGPYCYYANYRMQTLEVGENVKSIGDNAFAECTNLRSIKMHGNTPPSCGRNAFNKVSREIPLFVPKAALESYHKTAPWNEFNILAF